MSRVASNTETPWDDCTPQIGSINGIIVEIKDSEGVNHGVIRFEQGKPTLRIDAPSTAKWLDYRASNTPSGIENSSNDIKIHHNKLPRFYNLTCDVWNNSL